MRVLQKALRWLGCNCILFIQRVNEISIVIKQVKRNKQVSTVTLSFRAKNTSMTNLECSKAMGERKPAGAVRDGAAVEWERQPQLKLRASACFL